jgi:EmrB/QacA subfamily drug resistance transporter
MTTAMTSSRSGGAVRRPATSWDGPGPDPWRALWAMMVGFFMILVDSTIVAVANPSIMAKLGTGYDTVIWVTSAYLLAYAVPLLVAGRLGDRFGAKNLYLIGLAVFTAASLWCGLSGSITVLVLARVVQGVGAGLLTPQTLSMITRIFPPQRRGVAMSVWGATAGVATLVGPLAGGVLVDGLGWEWIFFINVPIGVVGLLLAVLLVPALPTHPHRFDLVAVGLSGAAMFLIVFALQEGQSAKWAPWIWAVLVAGVGLGAAFIYWQSINTREPLIPLQIFAERDFTLSNLGVAVIGFATTAMVLPLMFYAQAVCGLSPTRSALLMAPMAIISGALAPVAGKIVDKYHPGPLIGFGFSMLAIALTWLSIEMTPVTPIWRLVLPLIAMGAGNAFIWSPLAATATRNLPAHLAGASSGVYNATRQVGAVLGSAGMAAFMTSRITAEMPRSGGQPNGPGSALLRMPEFLREPFSAAMSQSMLLPAFVALFGVAAALLMIGFVGWLAASFARRSGRQSDRSLATERIPTAFDDDEDDDEDEDDDAYVELTLAQEPRGGEPLARSEPRRRDGLPSAPARRPDDDTAPLSSRVEHPPVRTRRPHRAESASSIFDEPEKSANGRLGSPLSGLHVDGDQRRRPVAPPAPPAADSGKPSAAEYDGRNGLGRSALGSEWDSRARGPQSSSVGDRGFDEISFEELWSGRSARPRPAEGEAPRNRHRRVDHDDSRSYGRHSYPD